MRTLPPSAGDGACYRRGNDGNGSSFRTRDNGHPEKQVETVKSLFKLLNSREEQ
jgi:hypothetical protein